MPLNVSGLESWTWGSEVHRGDVKTLGDGEKTSC